MLIALYPGSFDPVTNGHIGVATRAAALFDELVIGVFDTPPKNLLFTTAERVELIRKAIVQLKLRNVQVKPYTGLTVDFADAIGAKVLVRGLRMGSDFEREFDMALMNKKMTPHLETVCLMASAEHQFISSSLLKEAAREGGRIDNFVPKHVVIALKKKFAQQKRKGGK